MSTLDPINHEGYTRVERNTKTPINFEENNSMEPSNFEKSINTLSGQIMDLLKSDSIRPNQTCLKQLLLLYLIINII